MKAFVEISNRLRVHPDLMRSLRVRNERREEGIVLEGITEVGLVGWVVGSLVGRFGIHDEFAAD